jgi:hypothetical protein
MAARRGSSSSITPMPFPGESPTVSLALAAGQKYGLGPEEPAKPARAGKAKANAATKRKPAAKSGTAKASPTRKAKRSR